LVLNRFMLAPSGKHGTRLKTAYFVRGSLERPGAMLAALGKHGSAQNLEQ
jgi:hypothetical protein